jgi:hypothetical protein
VKIQKKQKRAWTHASAGRSAKQKRHSAPPLDDDLDEPPPPDFESDKLGFQLGAVYQGLDTASGRLVAIKAISLDKSPRALACLQQEIEPMCIASPPVARISVIRSNASPTFSPVFAEPS